jgi:predicted enzyme related to lactoylglutathione lyase
MSAGTDPLVSRPHALSTNARRTAMATAPRKAGEFCWINMLTPRPAEAMEFFAAVLGWTYFEIPGIGHGIRVGGRDIGGLFDLHGPTTPPGLPPYIGVMVKVGSADAAREKVVVLGGTAKAAFDVGEQGRMAVCFDRNGAEFDVWEPKAMAGSDADRSLHGAPSWTENMTTDVRRATAFYAGLFGWTPEAKPMPGFDYVVFKLDGVDVAGMMPIPTGKECVKSHWGTYFTVGDADEAARRATELGGTLFVPPMDIPGIGRFCGIESPQGVKFYAIRYLPRQGA